LSPITEASSLGEDQPRSPSDRSVGDIQVHLINFIKTEAFKRLYKELQQLPELNINDINSWGNETSDWFLREEEPATIRQESIEVDIPSPPHTPWEQSNPELNN
jgi:hypothetical protein